MMRIKKVARSEKQATCKGCGKPAQVGLASGLCRKCANEDLRSLERQLGLKPGELESY
jgi:hypothetical protein